jgi:hypothetical protein
MGNSSVKLLNEADPEYRLCLFNAPDDASDTTLSSEAFVGWCLGKVTTSKLEYFLVYKFEKSTDCGVRLHRELHAVSLDKETRDQLSSCIYTYASRRDDVLSYEYQFTRDADKYRVSLGSLVALYKNLHVVDAVTWKELQNSVL